MNMQQHLLAFALDSFRLFIWLLLLMIIFIPLERIAALHPPKVFCQSFLPDLAYYFLNNLLPPLLLILPLSIFGAALHFVVPRTLQARAGALPLGRRFMSLAGQLIAPLTPSPRGALSEAEPEAVSAADGSAAR
jgi:hypothetical protein